jgi:hypothetical protein
MSSCNPFMSNNEGFLLSGPLCKVVNTVYRNSILNEIWVTCSSIEKFYEYLEQTLISGVIIKTLSFLDGKQIMATAISTNLIEHLSANPLVEGVVTITYYNENNFIKLLNNLQEDCLYKNVFIKPSKRLAKITLLKPIKAHIFFDHGIRIIKPVKIPP